MYFHRLQQNLGPSNHMTFENIKRRYETTKPVRGDKNDIRPVGDRRRKHERVVKVNDTTYAYRYYETNILTLTPEMAVLDIGFSSSSGISFANNFMGYHCYRDNGSVWLRVARCNKTVVIPLKLRFRTEADKALYASHRTQSLGLDMPLDPETGQYVPKIEPYYVRVVDRKIANASREFLRPFIDFATSMLKLTDGWVSIDLIRDTQTFRAQDAFLNHPRHVANERKDFWSLFSDPLTFPALLVHIASDSPVTESRHTTDREIRTERQYTKDQILLTLYKMHADNFVITRLDEVQPDDCTRTNVATDV
jgi:hypothetical protein